MSTLWETLLRTQVSIMETGLLTMKAGMRSMQEGVEALSGHRTGQRVNDPPIHGPQDLDTAISEFVNHLIRIGRLTRPEGGEIVHAMKQVVDAARSSFSFVDLKDPRSVALPVGSGALHRHSHDRSLPARHLRLQRARSQTHPAVRR